MSQEQPGIRRPTFYGAGGTQEDILKLLDALEEVAERSYSLFGKAWGLDLEEFHMLVNKIRASLPDEVRRASRMATDSDKIIASAKEEAEAIIQQAHKEAERIIEEARQMAAKLIDTSEINQLAKAQAQEILANAEKTARETRRGADEYAREVLAAIENHLAKVMSTLQKGREKLESRISAEQEIPDPLIPMGRGVIRR
jgi:vacuolar-type H+-ATPase subunit H